MGRGNVVDTDCGCLLCKVPEHLITYLVCLDLSGDNVECGSSPFVHS